MIAISRNTFSLIFGMFDKIEALIGNPIFDESVKVQSLALREAKTMLCDNVVAFVS